MPDDEDYAELRRLITNPQTWTSAQTLMMRSLLRQQIDRLSEVHPFDTRRRASLQVLVDQISEAIHIAGQTEL